MIQSIRLRNLLLLVFLLPSVSGCTKLGKALTLKALGTNQEMQDLYVRKLDKKFEHLLEVYHSGGLDAYADKDALKAEFGTPLIARDQIYQGKPAECWLYRYHTKPFDSDKIYFYFNGQGKVLDYKFVKSIPKAQRRYNILTLFKKENTDGQKR